MFTKHVSLKLFLSYRLRNYLLVSIYFIIIDYCATLGLYIKSYAERNTKFMKNKKTQKVQFVNKFETVS